MIAQTLKEPKPIPLSSAYVRLEAQKMGGFPYTDDGAAIEQRVVPR